MFANRDEAGRQLARQLLMMRDQAPVVLALPRGGVPVAARVAEALNAPLDLMLVRKIGVPGHHELAVGAIAGAEGQTMVTNPAVAAMEGLNERDIDQLHAAADAEQRQVRRVVPVQRSLEQIARLAGRQRHQKLRIGHRGGDLAFKVKMVLTADDTAAAQTMRTAGKQ